MKHVLLVEDDPILLEATKHTLEKMSGFEVTGVVNAEMAIDEIMK